MEVDDKIMWLKEKVLEQSRKHCDMEVHEMIEGYFNTFIGLVERSKAVQDYTFDQAKTMAERTEDLAYKAFMSRLLKDEKFIKELRYLLK